MSQIAPLSSTGPDVASTDAANAAPAPGSPQSSTASGAAASAANDQASPAASQRLLIHESGELGVFVYTILDRSTGTVLMQVPQLEVADMATSETYSSGAVIDTTA